MSVVKLERKPDQDVIETLEEVLRDAREGRVTGILILGSGWEPGGAPTVLQKSGGSLSIPDAIYSFECWKHEAIANSKVEDQ